MTNIGTPDYQRGVVSAQALLATVAAGVDFITVGVPPNAESIIVVASNAAAGAFTACSGVQSNTSYPGTPLLPGRGVVSSPTWVYDVSAAIDSQVTINFTVAPTQKWYVYSDAGVHVMADLSKLTNSQGIPYYIPSAPSTAGGDHPPNELSVASANGTASGTLILPAPGAGKRYRIFYASVTATTVGSFAALQDSVSGLQFVNAVSAGSAIPGVLDAKPSGFPLSSNAAVEMVLSGGSGQYNITYTTETI